MLKFETEKIEYKQEVTNDIYKEVIAFANTDGGTIYVGLDNEGRVVGTEDIDNIYTKLTNGIRDAIKPDVTVFIKYTITDEGVIKIDVNEGSYKPYYLSSKGIKSSGVYIRQGTSSVQASYEKIRQMIKLSDGDNFEEFRSLEQDLTFNNADLAFRNYGVEFPKEKFKALSIVNPLDDMYNNLALLLSDQCLHSIKVATFADCYNLEFRDAKEFKGSIFKQLNDTFDYLSLSNKTKSSIYGLERIESVDYHDYVLREALLNAIIHRDYSFSGSIIININSERIEFISLGGILPGLSEDDIKNGISQPRNKNLADIFYRMRLIESYGTGLRRIFYAYHDLSVKPKLEITPNTFKLIIPNMNSVPCKKEVPYRKYLTVQEESIMNYIVENKKINNEETEQLLNLKSTRVYNILKKMCDEGLIYQVGRGKDKSFYRVK